MKRGNILWIVVIALIIFTIGACYFIVYGYIRTNPLSYAKIGDIPAPPGYTRLACSNPYTKYLRSLPLKKKGSKIHLYNGEDSRLQILGYAIIDIPLLSNAEQCADACMRLRTEALYSQGRYSEISFKDVNGHTLKYNGGKSRQNLERYLRELYCVANTYSLKHEMNIRRLSEIQPGDVFVYAAGDHDLERKVKSKYGHAIMVVDVAIDRNGKKVFMLAEGNTPARDIHVMRNIKNPLKSPWFSLDEDAEVVKLAPFYFHAEELRYW